jgi:hypothetical protein
MRFKGMTRVAAIGALCALVGAGAGIAGSSAATSSKSQSRSAAPGGPGGPPGGPFRVGGGPPVHSEAVVPNKAGDGFVTVTTDAGVVKSVSGDQLTITEGTKTLTYKNVTVTVPSGATIYRNGQKASLSALTTGDHVMVSSSTDGTVVGAFDSSHRPRPPHGGLPPGGPPPGGPLPG